MKYRTPCINFIKRLFAKLPAFLLAFLFAFGQPITILAQEASEPVVNLPVVESTPTNSVNEEIYAEEDIFEINTDQAFLQTDENLVLDNQNVESNIVEENTIEEQGFNYQSSSSAVGDRSQLVERNSVPKVDNATGSLNYGYKINVPSGRKNLQPDLYLNYNNQKASDFSNTVGYGWEISIPYIERINKKGTNYLYTENIFSSSIDGELVEESSGVYIPKVESGSFNKYYFNGTSWYFYDKGGIKYSFGDSVNQRQDDSTGTKVYKWMLSSTNDSLNNSISYSYTKDSGQIYPYKINYTNNGSVIGVYEIEFTKKTRIDEVVSYKAAFEVTNKYLIDSVLIKESSNLVYKYELSYFSGDNGNRSLLKNITETAYSSFGSKILTPTEFEYTSSIKGWSLDIDVWTAPFEFANGLEQVVDINGDSLQDILRSGKGYVAPYLYDPKEIWVANLNKTWTLSNTIQTPLYIVENEVRGGAYQQNWEQGVRVIDVNGDVLPDFIKAEESTPGHNKGGFDAYLNIGGQAWSQSSDFTPSIPIQSDDNIHNFGGSLVDLNADGLPETYLKPYPTLNEVQENNGFKFDSISTTKWSAPVDTIRYSNNIFTDLNGDGLVDLIWNLYSGQGVLTLNTKIYLNKGDNTWQLTTNWNPPVEIIDTNNRNRGIFFIDVNSDGLVDFVPDYPLNQINSDTTTYLNTGSGWIKSSAWQIPNIINDGLLGGSVHVVDIDQNGTIDLFTTLNSVPRKTYTYINNTTSRVDFLKKVTTSTGASFEFSYKRSSDYKNGGSLLNPKLPISVDTINAVITNDGLGNTTTTNYEYADGYYYYNGPYDRKFAGFGKVTKINPDGSKEVSYYSQGNTTDTTSGEYDDHVSKIGKIYRVDILDQNTNLIKQETTKWGKYQLGTNDAYFVYPIHTISRTGNPSYDTAKSYSYNTNNGNLEEVTEYGNVSVSDYQNFSDTLYDSRKTIYEYATCATPSCVYVYKQSKITVYDYNNNKASETKLYYDNLPLGQVDIGNNTKEENWVSGTAYKTTTKTYNTYGLVISLIDPRGNSISYTYDTYNLYPQSITNALSQITDYVYNYAIGKPIKITDSNGVITEYDYDGFGRPIAKRTSSDVSKTALITTEQYTYNDSLGAGGAVPYVKKVTNYSNILSGESYTLLDGLGRTIRNLVQSSGTNYLATDITYDSMGRVYKKSLPYAFSGSLANYSGPTANTNILSTNSYDTLGRLTAISNTLGAINYSYNQNKTTIFDTENKQKDIYTDAFGNISKVTEYLSGASYSTVYEWNTNNKLISMIDALNNIRSFTYDALGNRLTASDIHEVSDTDYGEYEFIYDANGNLIEKTTPNADIITFTYDAINRITEESNNGVSQIVYTYDICPNGIGLVCSITKTGSVSKTLGYTMRGLLANESSTIGSKTFTLQSTYDYAGGISQITYSDNSKIRNNKNNAGQIISIERLEPGSITWDSVLTNITYNPLGQKESIVYANGRTENYVYDATKQYQLNRLWVDGIPNNILDLNYIFSSMGNMQSLLNNTNPSNPKNYTYSYDDLHRLTSATLSVNPPATGYTENYTYNILGNILTKTGAGSYIYNGGAPGVYANVHAATDIGGINYDYDNNGNVIGFGVAPTNTTLEYNYRNELVKYQRLAPPNPVLNLYTYDENGIRIKSVTTSGTTYTPNKYYEENGTKKQKHIYLDDLLVATIIKDGTNPITPTYIHHDHLGGTVIVTDQSGNMQLQNIEYLPFGGIYTNTSVGSFDQVHKYTGHEYDTNTDLNYMQARYQYGVEGRFWGQDNVFISLGDTVQTELLSNQKFEKLLSDPQLLNSYSYGANNSLKNTDPSGNASYVYSSGKTEDKGQDKGTYYEKNDIKMLEEHAAFMSGNKLNAPLFKSFVQKGGEWDFKKYERGYYFFNGELVKKEEFGNIHYGYVGTATGLNPSILKDFAGIAQLNDNKNVRFNLVTNFDDPIDRDNIDIGIDSYLYKNPESVAGIQRVENLYMTSGMPLITRMMGVSKFVSNKIKK